LIYLFPLLIIAFIYNLLSEEKEGGTWKLVTVQSTRPVNLLMQKMLVRAMVVFGSLLTLLILSVIVLKLPLNSSLLAVLAVSVFYLLCWFSISCWWVSLQKNSSINAAALLSSWILLTIIIPGALNSYLVNRYPVPEAMATVVQQREGYHEKWDQNREVAMEKFYTHYPQFRKFSLPDGDFSWLWYYAMQQSGDDDAQTQTSRLYKKLRQREATGRLISSFFPSLHAQQQLNTIGHSGLGNQLLYLDSTARFHEKMRLHFYPKIFGNDAVRDENWEQYKMEFFTEARAFNWAGILLPFLIISGLFFGAAIVCFRKINQ